MTKLILLAIVSCLSLHALARPMNYSSKVLTKAHKASFEETYERVPSPYGILNQLKNIFPNAEAREYDCEEVTSSSAPVIGTIDPLQGEALEKEPGALFYQYYQDCIYKVGNIAFGTGDKAYETLADIFDENFKNEFVNQANIDCNKLNSQTRGCYLAMSDVLSELARKQFKTLSFEVQLTIMKQFITFLVGPEDVLEELRYIGSENVFGRKLTTVDDLAGLLIHYQSDKKSRDNPNRDLNTAEMYIETAIILRLGPALKN